jgi:hypothetical protein
MERLLCFSAESNISENSTRHKNDWFTAHFPDEVLSWNYWFGRSRNYAWCRTHAAMYGMNHMRKFLNCSIFCRRFANLGSYDCVAHFLGLRTIWGMGHWLLYNTWSHALCTAHHRLCVLHLNSLCCWMYLLLFCISTLWKVCNNCKC